MHGCKYVYRTPFLIAIAFVNLSYLNPGGGGVRSAARGDSRIGDYVTAVEIQLSTMKPFFNHLKINLPKISPFNFQLSKTKKAKKVEFFFQ